MSGRRAGLRRALVTGGAGFIGHHLVRALLDEGLEVSVLDDLSMGRRENLPPAVRFVEGDVRDAGRVDEALEGVDCVFHEAAVVSIRASLEGFLRDAEVNLMGTLNLLDRMQRAKVEKAILASSMAVYADSPTPAPLSEDAPTRPSSPYGVAKLASEQYWLLLCRQAGIEGTVLRYFNTYGPGQTPTPYVGVITIFVDGLLRGEPPTVFGDGEQRRDFVHVSDVVGANLAALRGSASGRTFNVGTGRATTVNEIAERLVQRLLPGAEIRRAPPQPGEMRNAVADTHAIGAALGWEARRAELDLDEVVAYWRERIGGSGRRSAGPPG